MEDQKNDKATIELVNSDGCEDKECPVCKLVRKCRKENREPSKQEILKAMFEPTI